MAITSFRGKHGFLSNFSPYLPEEYMEYKGIKYPSNEHFYQAMRFIDDDIKKQVASHPSKGLKAFCRQFKMRDNWDDIKLTVMAIGLNYKFNIPRYKQKLLETGNEELIEVNWWGDTFWGVCDDIGENNLGKLLMSIRKGLKDE